MLLRRVIEHTKAQNWFAVGLDFLIVVVGVFIGIEVANWNQARQDRQEERRYYTQLLVDLRRDLDSFSFAQAKADEFDNAAEHVLAMLEGRPAPVISRGRLATAIHHAGFIYIPRASRGTYDELTSTGNLGLLRDRRIKSEIAEYYEDFDAIRQWDTLLRSQQSIYWDYTAGILPPPVLRAAVRGADPSLTSKQEDGVWREARSRSRLPNLLVGMAAHQERIRRDSEGLAENAQQLIRKIEQHLDGSA
jgi:hypothetical protein